MAPMATQSLSTGGMEFNTLSGAEELCWPEYGQDTMPDQDAKQPPALSPPVATDTASLT